MQSAPPASDLTARARVREAAIRLFGTRGFDRTSIKAVAEAAGVSPALVIHHYGSKDGLRALCDEHVVTRLVDDKADAGAPAADLVRRLMADVGGTGPELAYVARMLMEPGRAGDELFTRLVASTEQTLADGRASGSVRPASDPGTTALLLTVFGLTQLLVRDRLAAALGADPFSAEGATRLTLPTLELLTEGLYRDSTLLEAARSALAPRDDAAAGRAGDGGAP